MTQKIAFFHCQGTSNFGGLIGLLDTVGQVAKLATSFMQLIGVWAPTKMVTVAGLHGRTAAWDLTPPGDPFCQLLDPDIFDAKKIAYPANILPIGPSIQTGVDNVIAAINALPAGHPFALGGYSQGGAVMSGVYNEIRSGSLTSRASDFLGGVVYGNPRRQLNYRGSVGGTWSGSLYNPTATTGGHGAFPTTGDHARLSGCDPLKWIEFTHPTDIFCAVGDTQAEQDFTALLGSILDLGKQSLIEQVAEFTDLFQNAWDMGGLFATDVPTVDGAGKEFMCPGGGHMQYAFVPPPGDPDNGLTSFQIAIKFLEARAAEYATAPIVLPDTPISAANAGWSATLIPPAA